MIFLIKFYTVSLILFLVYRITFVGIDRNFILKRILLILLLPITVLVVIGSNQLGQWYFSLGINHQSNIPKVLLEPIVLNTGSGGSSIDLFVLLWLIGVVIFTAISLWRFFHLILMIRSIDKWEDLDGNLVAYSDRAAAFSFWKWIHIPAQYKYSETVLLHELAHNEKKHTLDIIILEVLKIVGWFNPVIFLVIREIRLLHEFEVDHLVQQKVGKNNYINSLLNAHFGTSSIQFIQLFNNKKTLKMRINKLSKSEAKNSFKWRWIIPVLGVFSTVALSSFVTSTRSMDFSKQETELSQDPVYKEVDKKPEFKGGMDALIAYMTGEVIYPESAKKNNTQGTVFVSFVVSKSGSIKNAQIEKGVETSLDEEALRVVKQMPNWVPGEKDGKKVDVEMTLPIAFKL